MSGATTALVIGGIAAAGAGVAGSAISAGAAGKAADTQSQAANNAAQLQYQASQNALQFQQQQYNQNQQNMQPWLQSGGAALSNLDYLLGIGGQPGQTGQSGAQPIGGAGNPVQASIGNTSTPTVGGGGFSGGYTQANPQAVNATNMVGGGAPQLPNSGLTPGVSTGSIAAQPGTSGAASTAGGPAPTGYGNVNTSLGGYGSLMTPYSGKFTAPDALTEQNDPGYQARLALGTDAIQRSAAARGGVVTGGTAKDLNTYAQDYASNEYGNVYNRALTGYQTAYNAYNNDQTNQYNRLASLSGLGQQTAGQLATAGQNASNNVSSNLLNTASNIGQQTNNAAAATASGYVGGANAWSGGLNNAGNSLQNLLLLQQLQGGGSSTLAPGSLSGLLAPGTPGY